MDWADVQCGESHKEALKALGITPRLAAQLIDQLGLEHAEVRRVCTREVIAIERCASIFIPHASLVLAASVKVVKGVI